MNPDRDSKGHFIKGHKSLSDWESTLGAWMKAGNHATRGKIGVFHHTDESKKKIGDAFRGKKLSLEFRKKISMAKLGDKNPQWKGGITPVHKTIRRSTEFKEWRKSVFERDNYTCQECGVRGGTLHPDHIKPFAYYPELRFSLDNGRTLCVDCHKKTDTWGNKGRHLARQLNLQTV